MIYEVRTYDLKARTVAEYEKRFGEACEKRRKYSELAAFWHTEIGMLNQVVHVWPYKNLAERTRIRAAVAKEKVWPEDLGNFIERQQADIMIPFAISPELKPGNMGPFFEMRTYTYFSGVLPLLIKNWENAIDVRVQFGPVCALWYSELGALNKFIHIWPYRSLTERMEIRAKAEATGLYPPNVKAVKEGGQSYPVHAQENKIMMPAAFSPLQ